MPGSTTLKNKEILPYMIEADMIQNVMVCLRSTKMFEVRLTQNLFPKQNSTATNEDTHAETDCYEKRDNVTVAMLNQVVMWLDGGLVPLTGKWIDVG